MTNKNLTLIGKTAKAYADGFRYIINSGGTRSGKTFAVLTTLIVIAARVPNTLISVVSETFPHLRRGAVRDFQQILIDAKSWKSDWWSKSEMMYRFPNESAIEFFSADSSGKVHGPQRDVLFLNESQNINEWTARHLMVRTSGAVFIDFNPTHRFWVHDLEDEPRALWLHSTYLDNPFLTAAQVAEIERCKKDANWWRVYGLGLIGEVEGLVFPDWDQVDSLPEGGRTAVGLDFGYSIDPTAAVRVVIKGTDLYLDELVYQPKLLNEHIYSKLKDAGVTPYDDVWADSSEPKSIDTLSLMGLNVKPSVKGLDSINFGISAIKMHKIHVTKKSVNLIKELRNYTYKRDKDGRWISQPIDMHNHAIDAARYAVTMMQQIMTPYKSATINTNNRKL